MDDSTDAVGIHQSDVVIRAAIYHGLGELRVRPDLIEFAFSSLPRDELTARQYGEREIARAREWFLATEIPIYLNQRPQNVQFPCVSVAISTGAEVENTLADLHYEVTQRKDDPWPAILGPFTPKSYSPATGWMELKDDDSKKIVLWEGQVVVDRFGGQRVIVEVPKRNLARLRPAGVADLDGATIRGERPSTTYLLEGASFKEEYAVGCHAAEADVHLTYLSSLIMFTLLRHREDFLEGRGLERSYLQLSAPQLNPSFDPMRIWTRFITVGGNVRNYWPKGPVQRYTAAAIGVGPEGTVPPCTETLDLDRDALAAAGMKPPKP